MLVLASPIRSALSQYLPIGSIELHEMITIWIAMLVGMFLWKPFRNRPVRRAIRQIISERGYPTCVQCGYNLTGLVEPRCPECGTGFTPESVA